MNESVNRCLSRSKIPSQLFCVMIVTGWCVAFGLIPVFAASGSLEPPGSAVNGSGDPVATTQTQPSWDQNLPASERFKLVLGGEAVLDKETGLVWEQSPLTIVQSWSNGRFQCTGRTAGGKRGWRLPSVHELASLSDPTNAGGNPDLPAGHPFSNVQSSFYWSATTGAENPSTAWLVSFVSGNPISRLKTDEGGAFVWCVRGGGPLSEY